MVPLNYSKKRRLEKEQMNRDSIENRTIGDDEISYEQHLLETWDDALEKHRKFPSYPLPEYSAYDKRIIDLYLTNKYKIDLKKDEKNARMTERPQVIGTYKKYKEFLQSIEKEREAIAKEGKMKKEEWVNHINKNQNFDEILPDVPTFDPKDPRRTIRTQRNQGMVEDNDLEDSLTSKLALLDVCTSVESCRVIVSKLKLGILNSIPAHEANKSLVQVSEEFLTNTKRIDSLKDRVEKAKSELAAEIKVFKAALKDHLSKKDIKQTELKTIGDIEFPDLPNEQSISSCSTLESCQKEIDDLTLIMKGRLEDPDANIPIEPAMRLKSKVDRLNVLWKEYVNVDSVQDELIDEMTRISGKLPSYKKKYFK